MKKVLRFIHWLVTLVLLVLCLISSSRTEDTNPVTKKIRSYGEAGAVIKFSDLYSGDWDSVCFIDEYMNVSGGLSYILKKPASDFEIMFGDFSVSEREWAIAFVKDSKVRAFKMTHLPSPSYDMPVNSARRCYPYKNGTLTYTNIITIN